MQEQQMLRKGERGNVLFLILIAVALFAALSYAVTQSTRSGTGSTDREQSILSGASMTQYPTSLRTAVIRMVLGGTDVTELEFNPPEDFGDLTADEVGVFNNVGGGALFQDAPADLVEGAAAQAWSFNLNFQVPNLGTSDATGADDNVNELTAFLPNVTNAICVQVNREFNVDTTGCTLEAGIPTLDVTNADDSEIDDFMDELYDYDTITDSEIIQGTGCTAFTGQASGCFHDVTNDRNVFYSVLLER